MFTFIESAAFDRVRAVYLHDDEYAELQQFMMENPEAGDVVRESGGVRKLRWKRKGMGRRGGLRVIYFVRYRPNEFWLLTLYAKAKQENVPAHILRQLKEAFERA
ncbi:MAG: type II toxin-antitoxin system RelE/ParE family toxin [Deltaproteobacteria bacterium]|nr:type II toxin-antitoxin system RelE/ParE family toxin [Deltaproteobacteria bacterium]